MSDSCLFCGKAVGETDRYEVKMHGEHQTKTVGLKRAHSWKDVTVGVPCCKECFAAIQERHAEVVSLCVRIGVIVAVVLSIIVAFLFRQYATLPKVFLSCCCFFAILAVAVGIGVGGRLPLEKGRLSSFPVIRLLLEKKWKFYKAQKYDTWVNSVVTMAGLAAALFGVFLYVGALWQIKAEASYAMTSASVEKAMQITRITGTRYSLKYRYYVGGRCFTGSGSVSDFPSGGSSLFGFSRDVKVFYDAERPDVSTLELKRSATTEFCIMVFLLLVGSLLVYCSVSGTAKTKREMKRYLLGAEGGDCISDQWLIAHPRFLSSGNVMDCLVIVVGVLVVIGASVYINEKNLTDKKGSPIEMKGAY